MRQTLVIESPSYAYISNRIAGGIVSDFKKLCIYKASGTKAAGASQRVWPLFTTNILSADNLILIPKKASLLINIIPILCLCSLASNNSRLMGFSWLPTKGEHLDDCLWSRISFWRCFANAFYKHIQYCTVTYDWKKLSWDVITTWKEQYVIPHNPASIGLRIPLNLRPMLKHFIQHKSSSNDSKKRHVYRSFISFSPHLGELINFTVYTTSSTESGRWGPLRHHDHSSTPYSPFNSPSVVDASHLSCNPPCAARLALTWRPGCAIIPSWTSQLGSSLGFRDALHVTCPFYSEKLAQFT